MAKKLSELPVGALVKDAKTTYYGEPIIWRVLEHGHSGDPAGTTALMSDKIIMLKAFDAKEPSNSDSNRRSYGNNRYLYSNLLQWLNSDAAAGAWYSAKHSADQAPTTKDTHVYCNPYTNEAGFLSNFGPELKAALQTVSKVTAKNTVTDGGGSEVVASKIFLLSTTECGLANENGINEGAIYKFFADNNTNARRIMYATQKCIDNADSVSRPSSISAAWRVWLRTPSSGHSYNVRGVYTGGSLDGHNACYGCVGVAPAYAVLSSLSVSDSPDSDGAYVIQWNSAPTITTDSTSLGDKNSPFSINYSIKDPDGDSASATVSLDGNVKETIDIVNQGETYSFTVTSGMLKDLSEAVHKITISASDSNGNQNSVDISFTRTASMVNLSGEDGDLGNYWSNPVIKYQVSENNGKAVTIVESYGGAGEGVGERYERTIENAPLDTDITFDMDHFDELSDNQQYSAIITATNSDEETAIREWTFTKLASALVFYMNAIETDAPAKKIDVILDYSEENDPDVKIEVTNNAKAVQPTWEDMTDAWKSKKSYTFQNNPDSGFGVSVRVTINKNENTERVWVTALGYAFS